MSSTNTPIGSRRGSASAPGDASGNQVKKFLNGWTKEQERLMAEWADIAGCYRWLNDRAEKIFSRSNMFITIPVIILSTLTGTANFAIDSFVPGDDLSMKKYVSAGIGGLSIFAGILTTLGNFFQYAQKSEAHRVAGIAWGKFQRMLTVELAIHPDNRIDAMDFLKICRQDLDRLIEQSPPIPDAVVVSFEREFKNIPDLKKPDICHGIEHTRVFDASKPRLGKITADAAMFLKYKKAALARELIPAVEKKIELELTSTVEKRLQEFLRTSAAAAISAAAATAATASSPKGEGMSASVETDWRKLLLAKKHILSHSAMPTADSIAAAHATPSQEDVVPLESIVIHTVGAGDAPPSSSVPRTPINEIVLSIPPSPEVNFE